MKKIIYCICALSLLCSCANPAECEYNQGIHIIPEPQSMNVLSGEGFLLENGIPLVVNDDESFKIASFFARKIEASTGYKFPVQKGDADETASRRISMSIDPAWADGLEKSAQEAYSLSVGPNRVKIEAAAPAGAFYAMQSLMQLLPAEIESPGKIRCSRWEIPAVEIQDAPRFEYRGIMMDVCRHFRSVEFIKKQLDVLAMFKINRFHWHLTEDQAWRVEIKKYPRLTEVGSTRVEGEGHVHEGYYTQEEIKEIVAYAAERFITVVPELEVPGHELAAIAAYPQLSCSGEEVGQPWRIWGVNETVMCPGKELMFEFLTDVIDELAPLFPGEYFHIGGDECPKTNWKKCPLCQNRIRELGLKADEHHSAEDRLQSYVISRVSDMLARHGKKIIGWDEILEGGLAQGATVMSWRGEFGGIAAASMGHRVIMTPSSEGMYLDHYQGDYKVEPVAIGGYSTLEKVYAYDAVPEKLREEGKEDFVMGVQANLWSEYLYTDELTEYRLYPRALALAEIAWSDPQKKDFPDFCRRVDNACVRLDMHDIHYHIPQPEQVNGSADMVAFTDTARLEFRTSRPVKVLYTLNGMDPRPGMEMGYTVEYHEPIVLTRGEELRIASVLPSGKMSPVRKIKICKQSLSPAQNKTEAPQGYEVKLTKGTYFTTDQLDEKNREWTALKADKLIQIRGQECEKDYATIAEGYFSVPQDGVYFFASNNTEVWIDGRLVIDNNGEVKRTSHHDSSMALEAGVHKIRIIFLGHICGGVPSYWDDARVSWRYEKDSEWNTIL